MQNLYELLGALPEDDADHLRAAFREAAKAHHPDNNPDDPDAPQRFRRMVRARSILGDEQQRAFYDLLMGEAQQEQALNSKLRASSRGPGVIGCMVIASVSIGAFLLFERVLTASVVRVQDASAPVSTPTVAMPRWRPPDTVGLVGEHSKSADAPVTNESEAVVREMAAPVVAEATPVATAGRSAVVATPEVGVKDASYYRQRGVLAYRSGDLPLALVDFDVAISLDPNVPDAYIDRAIVFRRMGDMKHALSDIAEAKRIDDLKPP